MLLHPGDRGSQQDQVLLLKHPHQAGYTLGVVADGMGGRSGGRQASNQVVLTANQLFQDFDPREQRPGDLLRGIAEEAHRLIRLVAIAAEQEPHSTVAAFLLMPGARCMWMHCGDSRIYHFRGPRLLGRTLDHSYVQALMSAGQLTAQQARTHPRSHVLVSCLGSDSVPTITVGPTVQLRPGDAVLACSDGLWHYFRDEELGRLIQQLEPRRVTRRMLDIVRQRTRNGTGDNMAAIVVKVQADAAGTTPQDKPAG